MFANDSFSTPPAPEKMRQSVLTAFFQTARSPFQGKVREAKEKDEKSNYLFFPVDNLTPEELINTHGGRARVMLNDKEVALIYHKNEVYAIQEKCPHAGGALHIGDIEEVPGCGPHVKCPAHKWTFNLKTGECVFPQGRKKLEVYPVQLVSKKSPIKIGFTEFSPKLFNCPPE